MNVHHFFFAKSGYWIGRWTNNRLAYILGLVQILDLLSGSFKLIQDHFYLNFWAQYYVRPSSYVRRRTIFCFSTADFFRRD